MAQRFEDWDRDLTLVRAASRELNVAELRLRHLVGVACRNGHSWPAIGLVLGLSEQDARDKFGQPGHGGPR